MNKWMLQEKHVVLQYDLDSPLQSTTNDAGRIHINVVLITWRTKMFRACRMACSFLARKRKREWALCKETWENEYSLVTSWKVILPVSVHIITQTRRPSPCNYLYPHDNKVVEILLAMYIATVKLLRITEVCHYALSVAECIHICI